MQRKIALARSKRQAREGAPPPSVASAAPPIIENNHAMIPDHFVSRIPAHDDNAEITPEQLTEINSLMKMYEKLHKQDIAVTSVFLTLGMSIFTRRLYTAFLPALNEVANRLNDGCEIDYQPPVSAKLVSIGTFSLMALFKLLYLDGFALKGKQEGIRETLPELGYLEKINVKDANKVIKKLKEVNTENKKWTDNSSYKIRVVGFLFLLFLLLGHQIDVDPFYILAYGAITAIMIAPTFINDSRSIVLNYHLNDKLINKKKTLEEIFKGIPQVQCYLHQRDNIESSFYSFYLKNVLEDKISDKLACSMTAEIFKIHGFYVEMSLKYLTIAINADTYVASALAGKMNQEIAAQLKVISDMAELKMQIISIAKKMNLVFIFTHKVEGLDYLFYAHAGVNGITNDMIARLETLFAVQLSVSGAVLTIKGKHPLETDKFNAFISDFNQRKSVSSSSDIKFRDEGLSTKTISRILAFESSDDESQSEQATQQAPLVRKQSATIIRWPSGKIYDSSKPLNQQDIHPFISTNLPSEKFFATSSLTKEDFSSSSIPYLFDRLKQQVDCPTTATKKGTQGFVLNLFGKAKDAQGNNFDYNGKVKLKGNQVGDARAYFEYERDPESGAVLCDVKGWKNKTHKK